MKAQGLVQEAYNCYFEALRIQPTSAVACFNLAEIYKESGDLNKALHYYDKAVKLKPDYSDAYLNLGNADMDLKMCDNAIVCYQRWIQSRPDYVMAFSHLETNCLQIYELPVKPSLDLKVTGVLEVGSESSAGNGEPLLVPSNTAPDEESHKEEKLEEDPIVMISEIGSDSNAIEPEMEIKGVKAVKTETEDVASEVETEPFICDKEVEKEIEDVAPNSTGEGPPLHTTGIQGTNVSPLIQEEPCIPDGTQYDHKIKKNVVLNNQPTCSIDASFLEQVVVAFKEVKINQEETTVLAKEPISVNPSLKPTFLAIIKKYGDITKDCPLESGYMLTSVVEVICKVVQELQKKHLTEVDRNILNSYYLVVRDAEKIKINVNWLRAQLDEIKDVVKSIVEAKDLNDEKNRIAEQIENKKKDLESMKVELEKLKSEIERKENLLDMDTLKTEGLIRSIKDRGPRIQRFQNMVLMEEFQ